MKKVLSIFLVLLVLTLTLILVSCVGVTPTNTTTTTTTTTTTNQESPIDPPVDEHEHSYNAVVTAPTCTEWGYTTYTCDCSDTYVGDYVDAMGHTFGEWLTIKEPTATEVGIKERTCKCGDKESKTIPVVLTPSEGLEFALNNDGLSYSVTGIGTCTDTDIVIPDTYEGLPVTKISSRAFFDSSLVASINIPNSVTYFGENAFKGCSSLTDVYYAGDLEGWLEIGHGSYSSPMCNEANLYFAGELVTDITIPDSVTWITSYAFEGCTSLASVEIPDSVTHIGSSAFSNCDLLTSVKIPNSVTKIGSSVFSHCDSLTSVTLPDSIKSIGQFVFFSCDSLTYITIHNSLTGIGNSAFSGCISLTNISIPDSLTSISNSAFFDCTSLTTKNFEGTVEQWIAISKGSNWNYNVPATEVICSDGTVPLQ